MRKLPKLAAAIETLTNADSAVMSRGCAMSGDYSGWRTDDELALIAVIQAARKWKQARQLLFSIRKHGNIVSEYNEHNTDRVQRWRRDMNDLLEGEGY